jgi:hypothetical protein
MGFFSMLGGIAGNLISPGIGGAIGGALGGALEGGDAGNAASSAAQQTSAATDQATQLQREMWQAQQAQQATWLQAGTNALAQMRGGAFAQPEAFKFGANEFAAGQDPGYAFRVSEGQKALDRQAAARGGLISGGALKAAARYGQDMGSQEYQNAFNRSLTGYNANVARSDTGYNRLASMANIGQTAGQQLGAAGQQYGQNVGNAMINQGYAAGNALIAGQQGRESAYGQIGKALGGVSTEDWTKAGNAVSNWWNQ